MAGGRFSGQGQHIEDLGKFFCDSLGCDIVHVNANSRATAFARRPCAFRPRRLAESERPGLAGAGFSSALNTSTNPPAMHMCISTAQAGAKSGYALWAAIFFL